MNYKLARKQMTRIVILLEGQDLLFAKIAQGANVGGATLPSGFKVPDGDWIIRGNKCVKSINIDSSI